MTPNVLGPFIYTRPEGEVKPLVVMVTYNRKRETEVTLEALEATTDLTKIEFVIVDNHSTDGTVEMLVDWSRKLWGDSECGFWLHPMIRNYGCPKALNHAILCYRQPGQPVVKIDNDVRMLTRNWPNVVQGFLDDRKVFGLKHPVAMVGAWYEGVLEGRLLRTEHGAWTGTYHVNPVIGHTVWHTGEFMDAVGYFDVLASDHLYGFEDLLLSCKAQAMGWDMLVTESWQIQNIQRHNALGDRREGHITKMRPLYNARRGAISVGGTVRTDVNGQPANNNEEAL